MHQLRGPERCAFRIFCSTEQRSSEQSSLWWEHVNWIFGNIQREKVNERCSWSLINRRTELHQNLFLRFNFMQFIGHFTVSWKEPSLFKSGLKFSFRGVKVFKNGSFQVNHKNFFKNWKFNSKNKLKRHSTLIHSRSYWSMWLPSLNRTTTSSCSIFITFNHFCFRSWLNLIFHIHASGVLNNISVLVKLSIIFIIFFPSAFQLIHRQFLSYPDSLMFRY